MVVGVKDKILVGRYFYQYSCLHLHDAILEAVSFVSFSSFSFIVYNFWF